MSITGQSGVGSVAAVVALVIITFLPRTSLGGPATSSELWSLRPLTRPPVPQVREQDWPRNPIDHFVAAALERKGLAHAPEADRATLIRRLSFDLTGLPPTPEQIERFVSDQAPDAYERLVDRLLAMPQYGERWGRHWLDLARYTESQGFEYDHMRENGWHYRDYVIASFNQDKPYDRFMQEQIAGDVLAPASSEGIVATSFLVCGPWDQAGSSQANEAQRLTTREDELEDTISVVCQTFLGLTVNCARCHSHKFDPIPQEDYYRVKAVFEGVRHGESPIWPAAEVEPVQARRKALESEIASAQARLAELGKAQASAENGERRKQTNLEQGQLQMCLERVQDQLKALPQVPLSYVGTRKQPDPTHRLQRGNVRTPLEIVRPGALSAVHVLANDLGLAPDAPEGERRLRFSRWLADPRNPLPARVLVNRLWQYHFGEGIVATPNDFGTNGSKPTHPELLDWLASELVHQNWSIKSVQRLIVCSATYRQSSRFDPAAAQADAGDQYLWRFNPRRLEAEELRDAMLAVSGELNLKQRGPSFRPFETKSFNATFYFATDKIGPEFNRRTVYRMNINSGKDPMLDAFDCPEPSVKTPRRGVTITPLQALSLMNNSFVQRQAERLAKRVQSEAGNDPARAVALGYCYCFGRAPTHDELDRARAVAQDSGLETVCWALLNATEFLYVQ